MKFETILDAYDILQKYKWITLRERRQRDAFRARLVKMCSDQYTRGLAAGFGMILRRGCVGMQEETRSGERGGTQ